MGDRLFNWMGHVSGSQKALIADLFIAIRQLEYSRVVLTPEAFARMCSARDRLREVGEEAARVRDVARAEGASQFHFIRQFLALFGETPRQFQMQARIDRAKELLATTDLPVTEICMEVGFSSLGSFSALFARRVGEPPSLYRRRSHAPVGCVSMIGELPPGAAIFEKR